jgi:hypothetical protein
MSAQSVRTRKVANHWDMAILCQQPHSFPLADDPLAISTEVRVQPFFAVLGLDSTLIVVADDHVSMEKRSLAKRLPSVEQGWDQVSGNSTTKILSALTPLKVPRR